jgi:prepilin-type N-terminal cleavage/methylation domain-containing protein
MKTSRAFSLIELSIVILIIGILVAGVIQGSRLVKQLALTSARSLSKSSEATSISDLVLWLDVTAEDSLANDALSLDVSDGDTVETWTDQNPQSTQKFTFSQTTTGKQPFYKGNGINGLPTLFFDTDADSTPGRIIEKTYEAILNPSSFTIFAVVRPIEVTTSGYGEFVVNYSPNTGFILYKNPAANHKLGMDSYDGTNAITAADSSSVVFNMPYIVTASRINLASAIYKNGTQVGSATDDNTYVPNSTRAFRIGCQTGDISCFDGDVSEIIMYSRVLKEAERKAVEKYLGKKYGIKLS